MSYPLHGAARTAVLKKLDRLQGEYSALEWDITHDLIDDPGRCENGHDICGCEIHQAWCECLHDWRDENGL